MVILEDHETNHLHKDRAMHGKKVLPHENSLCKTVSHIRQPVAYDMFQAVLISLGTNRTSECEQELIRCDL